MKILVVGRGGREHSIIMKVAESERVSAIYAAPGNGGIAEQATCIPIDELDIDGLLAFAKEEAIDLTIIGPENPLNAGIANKFNEAGLAIFAPTKEAALLEGSKQFAKQFMQAYDIPTAAYQSFTSVEQAKAYIAEKGAPIVIKADGLAAGKGVIVAETKEQAFTAVEEMLVEKTFDEAGSTIVIEEFLQGEEFSLMAFVHENQVYPMVPARDHKRAYDQDHGPNTGGMGAFSPVPDLTQADIDFSYTHILQKTVDGLIEEGRAFTGILYAGLMNTEDGPKVIEFNTRFGDPETQVVLPLLKNDLVQVVLDVLAGRNPELQWHNKACVGVVLASEGYPGAYQKGVELPTLHTERAFIAHAGTKQADGVFVSDGGRVLLAGSTAASIEEAARNAYTAFASVKKDGGFFYRTDIAKIEMKQA
ncbi:MAG: phosphoribosylamine--glycine ligase [Bacillota bacterium]|uniref:Phosphoribosylamine--glycine ligase n=1 Tax=Virgibacillus salarius TaxID=447199 RepID=A0A941DRU1_9BACI|nr:MULTISPECIES: phosphoribosylamine--glycine ligase [Virgibacillus]MBR7795485.1 phosphoribosylamine--glycine ligase [Virgibacillus salarius]MDY7043536.1 phosphoribosylamine--glycine ligase [Virgibacillus sp. M23]NAZ08198.1 phosphoribosylamine--glycine ligase [Agaribacter marinus]